MDAFRRRSTPFLHSSLVIEILELPRSFHGGIVDESSVPNLYRGNRSNSFFTKYGGYGGRKNFHPYFSHEKFHFYLLREKKNIPMANNCRRHWQLFSPENPIDRNTLKRAPWTDSSLYNFFVPFSILYFFHSFEKEKEREKPRFECARTREPVWNQAVYWSLGEQLRGSNFRPLLHHEQHIPSKTFYHGSGTIALTEQSRTLCRQICPPRECASSQCKSRHDDDDDPSPCLHFSTSTRVWVTRALPSRGEKWTVEMNANTASWRNAAAGKKKWWMFDAVRETRNNVAEHHLARRPAIYLEWENFESPRGIFKGGGSVMKFIGRYSSIGRVRISLEYLTDFQVFVLGGRREGEEGEWFREPALKRDPHWNSCQLLKRLRRRQHATRSHYSSAPIIIFCI